jgi:tripartite-type tricarboxylate transporter receptor subunit TctC
MNIRRKVFLVICAAFAMTTVIAAEYPNRPIRLIVASAPGGNPDINSRNLASELSKQMGQQIVVENRPGASGIIGYEALARATFILIHKTYL